MGEVHTSTFTVPLKSKSESCIVDEVTDKNMLAPFYGPRCILDECGVHSDCNAPDPNKMYEFKLHILLNVLNVQIAT